MRQVKRPATWVNSATYGKDRTLAWNQSKKVAEQYILAPFKMKLPLFLKNQGDMKIT